MILQEEYNLNLASQLSKKYVKVSQYDTGRRFLITLIKNDRSMFKIPSEASASINGLKPDGNGFRYDCSIENNKVVVDLKEQMTVLAGCVKCEILLSKGGERIATANFMLSVEESPLSENTPISSTDIPLLQKAIEASEIVLSVEKTVKGYSESASKSAQSSQKSAESASSASASSSRSAQASAESASSASQSATNAQASAESASTSATTASTKATEAQTSAESAIQTKAEIEQLKKETIEQASTLTDSAKQEISTVKDATVTEVTELKNSTVSEITTLKDSTIEAVTLLKDTAKAEADRATESSASAKEQAEKAQASADSIANVTSDVEKLKEDLPNKITKFYASNQGETHITDSDNGKVQDMMIYGKSAQDGTPSVENPVEIKNVVNPTMNVCRKNLWDNFKTISSGNVKQKNGAYISTGQTMQIDITPRSEGVRLLFLKANNTYTFSLKTTVSALANKFVCLIYVDGQPHNFIFNDNNFIKFVPKKDVLKIGFILYGSVVGDKIYDIQLEIGSQATEYEPYKGQSIALPVTLNAIPVSSGGNVTIYGQQYVSDRVVEKDGIFGIERNVVDALKNISNSSIEIDVTSNNTNRFRIESIDILKNSLFKCICNVLTYKVIWSLDEEGVYTDSQYVILRINKSTCGEDEQTAKDWIKNNINKFHIYACLKDSKFEPLSSDVQEKLRSLTTYYPVTNITVGSEQLDGYTVFNYPISLANGWNYVKQQLNDNRDYIYDMDLQSAEAYVNSEYAVTLTELEV